MFWACLASPRPMPSNEHDFGPWACLVSPKPMPIKTSCILLGYGNGSRLEGPQPLLLAVLPQGFVFVTEPHPLGGPYIALLLREPFSIRVGVDYAIPRDKVKPSIIQIYP